MTQYNNKGILFLLLNKKRCLLVFLLAGLGFFGGCHRSKKGEENIQPTQSVQNSADVLVRTFTIPQGETAETRSFPIFAKQAQTAKLSFRVPGQLLAFNPILGSRVSEGEVIAQLDPRDYQLAVERLEQGINEANAALSAMKTGARAEDVASLEAQVAAAETGSTNAKKQLDRMERLLQEGTASQVQYDLAKTTSDSANAQFETLKKQLEKATKGARAEEIEAMEAKIAGLNVDLRLAKNKLADTELKAPFNGIISQKYFDNFETVAPGVAVLELADADGLEATLNVPEEIVLRQGDIQEIQCRFPSIPNEVFYGQVKEIGRTLKQENLSYPLTVRIQYPENGAGKELLPGMSGTAEMALARKDSTQLIPTAALIPSANSDDGGNAEGTKESAVWKINPDGSLERFPIRVKTFTPDGAIVEGGFSGGEVIVGAGARFLEEGQKVRTE